MSMKRCGNPQLQQTFTAPREKANIKKKVKALGVNLGSSLCAFIFKPNLREHFWVVLKSFKHHVDEKQNSLCVGFIVVLNVHPRCVYTILTD